MNSRINFVIDDQSKVLLIVPREQSSRVGRYTAVDFYPMLSTNPIISTYTPITDMRRFAGYIGMLDLIELVSDFRAARVALGKPPYLSVPQVLLVDKQSKNSDIVQMVKSTAHQPDLVKAVFSPKAAWKIAAPGMPMPEAISKALRARRFFGLF